MSKHSMSNKEKAVLRREKALVYDTDRLGPGSLMIQQSHTNSSRVVMTNHQLRDFVSVKEPEQPLVPTGFENKLASYSHMNVQADEDYEIVAKFVKNEYNYVLIGFDKKHRVYHAWKRVEMEEHSEGFSTRYNNKYMDSLEIGDTVKKGDYVQKSANFDKNMNYCYGKNVNVVYLVSPHVYEDGILAMNGVDKMFNTYRSYTLEINLADNDILLNWFGDEHHYQGIPLVGEKCRKGFAAIVRRIDNAKAPYSLKKKRLSQIERGDRKYYVNGRVIDIDILTNKDPSKLIDVGAMKTVNDLYAQQQDYYQRLYRYMRDVVDRADDEGYTYTDDFSIICEEAHDYVDSSAFLADNTDSVYGNTKIILHILDEEKMIVGSKLVGRSGNKGVISKIIPEDRSWHMEDGRPIHFVVATLGIIGRLNQSQLNEHSVNELSHTVVEAMKQTDDVEKKAKLVIRLLDKLNKKESKKFKSWFAGLSDKEKEKTCKRIERQGITVIQEPINNANILDFAEAYEEFPADYQRIVFPDGAKSLRRVLCAKMFYIRLKQDPLEKYSSRSKGPVNPLTTLPSKSNLRKKFLAPYSDVPVRFGEMELEILMAMVNHPAAIADFMMENSTSFDAKLAEAERCYLDDDFLGGAYFGDGEEDWEDAHEIDPDDLDRMQMGQVADEIEMTGKKNLEWISAYLSVLGTEIDMDVEEAPEGEYFDE